MFGSRRVITVNSSVYNLAGDIAKRPNFLKTFMTEQALYKTHESFAQAIASNYINGPGVKLRNLAPYALRKNYYDLVNQDSSSVSLLSGLDSAVLDGILETTFGYPIILVGHDIGSADLNWFGYKYLAENLPARVEDIFEVRLGASGYLEVDFFLTETDTTAHETIVTDIAITDLDFSGEYIYAAFRREYETLVLPEPEDPEEPEEPVEPEVPDLVLYPLGVYIYKKGSGVQALDDLFSSSSVEGRCLPIIPIKYDSNPGRSPQIHYIDKDSVGDDATLYKASKRLLARVADMTAYDGIIKNLKSIPDHGQINYGFIVHAVPVNSSSNSAKKYLYHFFNTFGVALGGGLYENYEALVELAKQSIVARNEWQEVHRTYQYQNPLWGTPAPKVYPYPTPPTFSFPFRMHTASGVMLDYVVKWNNLTRSSGSGLFEDMSVGEVRTFMVSSPPLITYPQATGGYAGHNSPTLNFTGMGSKFRIIYQKTADLWEEITVHGLHSTNIIHRGIGETLRAQDAFNEEEESSFIIPLHTLPLREMNMVDLTQFSSSSTYLMLNYYKETKKKWYQTGLFKFIVIVAAVVLTVFSFGKGLPVAVKMLSLAAAAGATALAIAIAKLAATALIALILSKLIINVSVDLLGDIWGTIVGVIASMYLASVGGNYLSTGNLVFTDFFSATTLMQMTTAVMVELSNVYEDRTNKLLATAQYETDNMNKYMSELALMYQEEFNVDGLEKAQRHLFNMNASFLLNSPETFLHRTLLTGSDIAHTSMEAISTSLKLPLYTTT